MKNSKGVNNDNNGVLGSWRTSEDHPNYSILENGQNTKKSPGELRRLALTQTPVKEPQLTPIWKTLKVYLIIIIMREFSKLAHNVHMTRHEWAGKVIHWELRRKLKFDHTTEWHLHKPVSVLENETFKNLHDLRCKPITWLWPEPYHEIINKKKKRNLPNRGLCWSGVPESENQRKRKVDKKLDFAWELKENNQKEWKMKVTAIQIVIGVRSQGLERGKKSWKSEDNSIAKIGKNNEKSPGNLMRLAVTQTPVKDYQLTLTWKTR